MATSPLGTIVSSSKTIITTVTTVSEFPNGGEHIGVVHLGATPEITIVHDAKYMKMPSPVSNRTLIFERNMEGGGITLYEELDDKIKEDVGLDWECARALVDFLLDCLTEHGREELNG